MTICFGPESMFKQIYEKVCIHKHLFNQTGVLSPLLYPSIRALLRFSKHLRINAFFGNPLHFLHIFGLLFFPSHEWERILRLLSD